MTRSMTQLVPNGFLSRLNNIHLHSPDEYCIDAEERFSKI